MESKIKVKRCATCHERLDINLFGKTKSSEDGYNISCKKCVSKRHKAKKYNIKKKYGIDLKEFNKLLLKQRNKCAICGIHQDDLNRSLAIDHNHNTGKIRGLLCTNCNTALGMLKENEQTLINMISYIKEYDSIGATEYFDINAM